jgi:hypothetical protein
MKASPQRKMAAGKEKVKAATNLVDFKTGAI